SDSLLTMNRRAPAPLGAIEQDGELVRRNEIAYVEAIYPPKWIVLATPELEIDWGTHFISGGRGPAEDTAAIVCLHAPLRSKSVLIRKVDSARPREEL